MKKSNVVILVAIILVLGVALGAVLPYVIAEFKEEVQDSKIVIDKGNNKKENTSGVTNKGTADTKNSQAAGQSADISENDSFIGEEKAKEIALESAGVGETDVVFEKVKLERDDGVWQYEIEFRQGRTEYDFDIHAETGDIISYDVDNDD